MGNEVSAEEQERREADEAALHDVRWGSTNDVGSGFATVPTIRVCRGGVEHVPTLRWEGWKGLLFSGTARGADLSALAAQLPNLSSLHSNHLKVTQEDIGPLASVFASHKINFLKLSLAAGTDRAASSALVELLCSWLASDAPLSLNLRLFLTNSPEDRAWARAAFEKVASGLAQNRTLLDLCIKGKEFGEGVVPVAPFLRALEGHPSIQEVDMRDCLPPCQQGSMTVKNIPSLSTLVLMGSCEVGDPAPTTLVLEDVPLLRDATFLRLGIANVPACLPYMEHLQIFQISDNLSEDGWFLQ